MTNRELANEITFFFLDYNMLDGCTTQEMYDATYRALQDNNIEIILSYFIDLAPMNKRANLIYRELLFRR